MNEKQHSNWVTVSEAARHLRVSRNTIYEACRENELESMRVRSLLRVMVDLQEEYLTVAETAEYLKVCPSTVYDACSQHCANGRLPHMRIRSRIRIPRSKLEGNVNQQFPDKEAMAYPGQLTAVQLSGCGHR